MRNNCLFLPTSAFRFHLFLRAGSLRSYAFDHGILVLLVKTHSRHLPADAQGCAIGQFLSPTKRNAGHYLQPAPGGNDNPRKPLYNNDLTNNPIFSDETRKA